VIIESDTEVQDILGFTSESEIPVSQFKIQANNSMFKNKEQELAPQNKKTSRANTADIEMINSSPQPLVIDEDSGNKLKKSMGKQKLNYGAPGTASSQAVGSKNGNTHGNTQIELENSPATTRKPMNKDSSHAIGSNKGNTHESNSELESESDDTPYTTPATTRKPLSNYQNFTNAQASSSSNTANNIPLPTREEFSNIMIRLR
jgi:hypothetical protein